MHIPLMTHSAAHKTFRSMPWQKSRTDVMVHKAASAKMSAPWAVLGMIAAFAGGTAIGLLGGKKAAMTAEDGGGSRWSMRRHKSSHPAAPGATGEHEDDRNEGE